MFLGKVIRLAGGQRGITGLETAIVLIAFVVVSSVFAFAALSTGLFSSDKAKARIPHLAQTSDAVNRQLSCFSSRYMNLLAVFQI